MASAPGVLDTVAGPAALDDIAAMLERVWVGHPEVPAPVRLQVGIAVAEIGANIIEHAGSVHLRVEVLVTSERVRVSFVDDGRPAEVDLHVTSMPDQTAERGRGLAMARAVLDRLHYRRIPVNNWTLVSRRFA